MNANDKLLVTLEGGVKRITFNRPERRNAFDFETFEAFAAAIEETARDESRVVVVTGAGEAFCSGLDLSVMSAGGPSRLDVGAKIRELIHPPVLRMRALPKPFVARVHGPAVGIGFSYVLASDIVIASRTGEGSSSYWIMRMSDVLPPPHGAWMLIVSGGSVRLCFMKLAMAYA